MPSVGRRPRAATRRAPRRRRGTRALVAVGGTLLLTYGMCTLFVAAAWGPGNSDELVSGGPELIPWYGLSGVGTLAAVVSLALVPRGGPCLPRRRAWPAGLRS